MFTPYEAWAKHQSNIQAFLYLKNYTNHRTTDYPSILNGLLDICMYFCLWTEASSLRHMPEALWFFYWCGSRSPALQFCCWRTARRILSAGTLPVAIAPSALRGTLVRSHSLSKQRAVHASTACDGAPALATQRRIAVSRWPHACAHARRPAEARPRRRPHSTLE
jgi:hypothetical protein